MGAAATAELETFERADLDAQLRLAELHAEAGYNPNAEAIRKMVERGIGPMAGAAQGLNPSASSPISASTSTSRSWSRAPAR
jgi:hypothetical protein